MAYNVFGLYARWRFKAQTFKQALTMIESQMFNLPLHRHWRKTRVTGSRDSTTNLIRSTNKKEFKNERRQKRKNKRVIII